MLTVYAERANRHLRCFPMSASMHGNDSLSDNNTVTYRVVPANIRVPAVLFVLPLFFSAAVAKANKQPAFVPLTHSAVISRQANDAYEWRQPWLTPAGVVAINLTSLHEIEADPLQSSLRVAGLGRQASMTDMNAFDPGGRYVFIPHETRFGGGVSRYDIVTDRAVNLFHGDGRGAVDDWRHDYGSLDPATWTPRDTLLIAEEWSGQGRVFELLNPLVDTVAGESVRLRELQAIPNVAHEGLRFNRRGDALYFVDENYSGSIYKFVPGHPDDYSNGQSYVLVVDAFGGNAAAGWNEGGNRFSVRTGAAVWRPITDPRGVKLTRHDPFANRSRGGRAAADEVNGTPFGRPEDIEVGRLANGHEVLYFTATAEDTVYAVEELDGNHARVRVAADPATPRNLGFAATSGRLKAPDNLAQDSNGNIYILEDSPGDAGADIWFMRDSNRDGIAESLDHFMSLRVRGAEHTGMIFRPGHPGQFAINVQHPDSTADRQNGHGDALWLVVVSGQARADIERHGNGVNLPVQVHP